MFCIDLKNQKVCEITDEKQMKKIVSTFTETAKFCVHCGCSFDDFISLAVPHRLEADSEIIVCQKCKKELQQASDEAVKLWLKDYKKTFIKYPLEANQ